MRQSKRTESTSDYQLSQAPNKVDRQAAQELSAEFGGELLLPGDEGYEAARKVWNGAIDKHPAIVARCRDSADVLAAVNFARERGLLVAVRGGGHNVAGNATCDGGIVIDLSLMKETEIDSHGQFARAQPGLTWGEFDTATQAHGLAVTGGIQSTTGIAGFTLGGGFGYLARKHGLTCDNLLSARVVTADGRLLTASENENGDLFWGLRGGGGNFGVVTEFELRLHPLGKVFGGMLIHRAERARDLIRFYRDFIKDTPDELFTVILLATAPAAPHLSVELHGKPFVAVLVCYSGDPEEGQRIVQPLREFEPPAADLLGVKPYHDVQTMLDAANPPGRLNYWKSEFFTDYTDEVIDIILAHAEQRASPYSKVLLTQMRGAVARVPHDETAYVHRDAPYLLNINAMWTDPAESEMHTRWARDFWSAMLPYSAGGVYVNFLSNEGEDRVKAAYDAPTYERLVALKNKYDPTNLFRLNQNIRPATSQGR